VGTSPRSEQYSEEYHEARTSGGDFLVKLMKEADSKSPGWQSQVDALDITPDEVKDAIMSLKDVAVGPDEITAPFLQATLPWSSTILYSILIRSLRTLNIPRLFRESDICPIYKGDKKPRSNFTGYRPIALTSIPARLVEGIIAKRLRQFLEDSNVLRDTQFGARAGRNTVDALTYFFTQIDSVQKSWGEAHATFLDISKAFDRVDHLALCEKLRRLHVRDVIIAWVYRFLSGRRQRVKVGGDKSHWQDVRIGIPQSTKLGPILFLAFINDCPIDRKSGQIIPAEVDSHLDQLPEGSIFVDDIGLWATGPPSTQRDKLNRRLEAIFTWSNDWGVDFSIEKTRHMVFGKDLQKLHLTMGQRTLTKTSQYKYLGLWWTPSLNFNYHVSTCTLPKVRRLSGYIRYLTKRTGNTRKSFLRLLWNSKISPVLEYGAPLWSSLISQNNISKIDSLQFQYFRKGLELPQATGRDALLTDLGIPRL